MKFSSHQPTTSVHFGLKIVRGSEKQLGLLKNAHYLGEIGEYPTLATVDWGNEAHDRLLIQASDKVPSSKQDSVEAELVEIFKTAPESTIAQAIQTLITETFSGA